jgi:DNA polymerase III delta subunit
MLYLINGTDTDKTRKKLNDLVDALKSKRPDANVFRVDSESFTESFFEEVVSGLNLFTPKNIVIIDRLLSDKNTCDYIEKKIKDLAESEHVCVIFDTKITAAQLKKIEKVAVKTETHDLKDAKWVPASKDPKRFVDQKKKGLDVFSLANTLLVKDKVKSWVLINTFISSGIAMEEIHGIVWWQFKTLYLSFEYKTAKEAGINPFVFKKCTEVYNKWKKDEVQNVLSSLFTMYHKAHRGECDFAKEMEMFCVR